MILGTALVGSSFALFFANMHRRQAKKEEKDIIAPGALPTCSLVHFFRQIQFIYTVPFPRPVRATQNQTSQFLG